MFSYELLKRAYSIFLSCFEEFEITEDDESEQESNGEESSEKTKVKSKSQPKYEGTRDGMDIEEQEKEEAEVSGDLTVPSVVPLPPLSFKANSASRWMIALDDGTGELVAMLANSNSKTVCNHYSLVAFKG